MLGSPRHTSLRSETLYSMALLHRKLRLPYVSTWSPARGLMTMLTGHPLSQESVLQATGAKQELPARIPWMGLGASSAPQDTTVSRVLSTPVVA